MSKPTPLHPQTLTVKEAAAILRISKNTLYRHLLDGTMPGLGVKAGNLWRIGPQALADFISPQPVRRGPARLRAVPKRYRRRERAS